ncbi:hypothetical protein K9U39_02395 [Rhodoblastus acidophilus]|uniref:Uncharacterized protein n=1 Tax=Candidatus Rhodoblastus alkanivorans TaxID=2954117 RepID=A0ABS9Z4H6_9HYPH|nr:hypothetical protein [Candidatus Rhodoblastus alkanivorans]MCI4680578.1 hypothetical protein [Candidatus Rhodoblastus alkanivorans]MCI4682497.1 hypothetical protein [Candidatus Rhodoblastus alkanivorans]MDI4639803.1 hypothetical protein [Rhodoblastus acidophilus]
MVCASVFVQTGARADDSLWGKAMSTIGLGAKPLSSQDGARQQPAAVAPEQAKTNPSAAQPMRPVSDGAGPAAAPGQNQNLLTNWFGLGRHNDPQPTAQAALEPQRKALTPVDTPPPAPAPGPSGGPGLWDQMLGTVGLNSRNPADNIYYADRPKLTVPKARALPEPEASRTPAGTRPSNPPDLIQPPQDYLEKVRGADGNVSGLRPGDEAKDKKFFGLF